MARGGKRSGAGRPSEFREEEKAALFQAALEQSSDRILSILPKAIQVLEIVALGDWQEMRYVKPTGRGRAQILSVEECEDGQGEPVYLCTHAPDKQCLLALIEHGRGKAAQTARVEMDTTINLVIDPAVRPGGPRGTKPLRGAPDWESKYTTLLPEERAKP